MPSSCGTPFLPPPPLTWLTPPHTHSWPPCSTLHCHVMDGRGHLAFTLTKRSCFLRKHWKYTIPGGWSVPKVICPCKMHNGWRKLPLSLCLRVQFCVKIHDVAHNCIHARNSKGNQIFSNQTNNGARVTRNAPRTFLCMQIFVQVFFISLSSQKVINGFFSS